jgi:hypothetical protein
MTLSVREQIEKAKGDAKPVPFVSSALGGVTVFIRRMSSVQVSAWWAHYYGFGESRPSLHCENTANLAKELCVEQDGKLVFDDKSAKELAEDVALGAFLEEFYNAACRVNFLFGNQGDIDKERIAFLGRQTDA